MLLVLGCGSRSRQPVAESSSRGNTPQQPTTEQGPAQEDAPRTRLISELPALSGKPAGTEFEFVLRATLVEPVFQGSARIIYDSNLVEPVNATSGKGLPSGVVVLARTNAAPGTLQLTSIDRPAAFDGCVPFAFTSRPGGAAISPGAAELLRVKFRLKRASPAGIPVRLQNDPQFLQLRSSQGLRLAFDLEREAAAR
jgi:hypothetical protein